MNLHVCAVYANKKMILFGFWESSLSGVHPPPVKMGFGFSIRLLGLAMVVQEQTRADIHSRISFLRSHWDRQYFRFS